MTRTARRRWTRELSSEVDGIAVNETGPVLLHGYDPPAGGRWVDSAIPGKLVCLDRATGELRWSSPCEVGYGRGFGAGFGSNNDAIVLGPSSSSGHRIVRMSLENGELVAIKDIDTFDEALVDTDLCVCSSAQRVFGTDTATLEECWSYARKGERYHHIGRVGDRVYVVFTHIASKKQGVLTLDARTGRPTGVLLPPNQDVIHDLAVDEHAVCVLLSNLTAALPQSVLLEHLMNNPDDNGSSSDGLGLFAMAPGAQEDDAPLWYEALGAGEDGDEFPELAVSADCGKVYVINGALLDVRDALTGRALGDWAIPGLDERVAWKVSQGGGLLAEETRVSVFELPA